MATILEISPPTSTARVEPWQKWKLMAAKVLVVDDDQAFRDTVCLDLRKHGIDAEATSSPADALQRVTDSDEVDAVLVDLVMPQGNGIDLCRKLVTNRSDVPVIAVTGFGSLETAIEVIRAGAHDFVTKPVDFKLLRIRLDRALEHRALQQELKLLRSQVRSGFDFENFIGSSEPMRVMFDQIARAAESQATVLVTGESGSGKELVAGALHARGPHPKGPFVAVNCTALPEQLVESELFGHVKGAFTDARESRTGIFVQAHRGTVFLDEIAELPLPVQPKLLRALEERKVRPVGGREEVSFDVRVVTATNRDLDEAVDEGRFREDLFFRLNVIQIEVPPLRRRGTDVLLLAHHFLERFAGLSGKAVTGFTARVGEKLMAYSWPGNVRELRNAMERAVALTHFEELIVEDLPERIRDYQRSNLVLAGDDPDELVPLNVVERRYIERVMESVGDNKALAARILAIDRKTLYRKLERYAKHDSR